MSTGGYTKEAKYEADCASIPITLLNLDELARLEFRRGEKAFGVFLVFRGTVRLDFGVDASTALTSVCGPGALVGLPASLASTNYSMTATVTDNTELRFVPLQALVSLLREHPELCQQLLTLLSAKVAYSEQVIKALLRKERMPGLELGIR